MALEDPPMNHCGRFPVAVPAGTEGKAFVFHGVLTSALWCPKCGAIYFGESWMVPAVGVEATRARGGFIDELAREILISWCANPQMFSEGAHVPYEALLINAREFATYAWVEGQTKPRTGAELLREIRERGIPVDQGVKDPEVPS